MKLQQLLKKFIVCAMVLSTLPFIPACGVKEKILPVKEAYNDGFRVVLIDGDNIESLILKEADKAVTDTATFFIDRNKQKTIEKELERKAKDSPETTYPFVHVDISTDKDRTQIVGFSYHFSSCTYNYCYKTDSKKVTPLWSSYKDFRRNVKSIYRNNTK